MQHVIKKQIIELGLPKESDAFGMQQRISDHYRNDILPLMEQVFDALSDNDSIIHIDELEIDLGTLSEKKIKQNNWDAELLSKIKEQLYQKISGEQKNKVISHESTVLSICRQWLFYMQEGRLPWNALKVDEAWYRKVLEALATDFMVVSELREMIVTNQNVLKRITRQHAESFLVKLTEILTAESQSHLPEAITELNKVILSKEGFINLETREKEFKVKVWEQLIRWSAGTEKELTMERLIEKLIIQYLQDISEIKLIVKSPTLKLKVILPVLKRLEENPKIFSGEKRKTIKNHQEEQELRKKDKDATKSEEIDREEVLDEEGVFVPYAGIVLIHPFLNALFKRLQWLKERRFENTEAKQKALYLLYYIANGNISVEEHELTIPKFLCNWPLDMPVEKEVKLTPDELSEADNMLEAAIEQWAVLKNTSLVGLREGFLQRNGKLFIKNNNRYLQVESQSIDILLDQLPWNLSLIKLPWMRELLRVEWR